MDRSTASDVSPRAGRQWIYFCCVALIGAYFITRGFAQQPGFTDAFYHFNAAERQVRGSGLTEDYLWIYIGAPDALPAPSHLYWMPMTSLSAALGMWALNAPGSYAAAQLPLAAMLAATASIAFWLGKRLGGGFRHAWIAGLATLTGGFFMRFWGATDTFAPYALFGAACLSALGLGLAVQKRRIGWFVLAGALAGLGHLTRADGVLLLFAGWSAVLLNWLDGFRRSTQQSRKLLSLPGAAMALLLMTLTYLLVMMPWFARNVNLLGTPLPVGGAQGIWFTAYDDIFNYPPDSDPQTFFANGVGLLLSTRRQALVENAMTFIAVEGMIVLTPLMLVGLWRRRRDPFLSTFWLYALGLHLVMTFVFPFPGTRGGLFHSAAALLPWWAALGAAGLDDVIEWLGRRRRWKMTTARRIFSAALVVMILFLGLFTALPRRAVEGTPPLYALLAEQIPAGARVMVNDPAQLYYFTGLGGVVLPNEAPDVIPTLARKYDVRYLLLEGVDDEALSAAASPKLWPILANPPDFLIPIQIDFPGVRLYEIFPEVF